MSRLVRLSLVSACGAIGVACGSDADGRSGTDEVVCGAADREMVVNEQLTPDEPSSAFVTEADDDVWVGLIADGDASASALVPEVTGLYVIGAKAPVVYTRDDLGGVVTDARYLDYDDEGQFVPLDVGPGAHRLWSVKSPEIQVIRCTASTD
jgi:hypothetical protein